MAVRKNGGVLVCGFLSMAFLIHTVYVYNNHQYNNINKRDNVLHPHSKMTKVYI